MPGATLGPSSNRIVAGSIARTERIERRTVNNASTPFVSQHFSYPGTLVSGIESPPWYVPRSGLISLVRVSTKASSSQTISVNLNGASAGSFAKTGGTHLFSAEIGVIYGDFITVTLSSGDGQDMSVELKLA